MLQLWYFMYSKRRESERGNLIWKLIPFWNLRLPLLTTLDIWDISFQLIRRERELNMKFNSFLKLEVISPYNFRYFRYFISKKTVRERYIMNIELNHHFNLGVILLLIWDIWVFLKQKRTESERGTYCEYFHSSLIPCYLQLCERDTFRFPSRNTRLNAYVVVCCFFSHRRER